MERAATFLGRTLRRLERPEAAIAWLTSTWPSIVGKALAAHTRPVRCDAGILEVTADGKAWQNQLESMAGEFSAQVNCAWGGDLVREVRFVGARRVVHPAGGSAGRAPRETDNDHTPFVRRRC